MDNPNNNYSLWGNATGWIVAFFLTKKALADRDKRLDNNDEWKKKHEENHPNLNEFLRMHTENRETMKMIMEMIDRNHDDHKADFKHLSDRMDRVAENNNGSR